MNRSTTGSLGMNRELSFSSFYVEKRHDLLKQSQHISRVLSAQPDSEVVSVGRTSSDYPHLRNDAKRRMAEEERRAAIDNENMILLTKMRNIFARGTAATNGGLPREPEVEPRSLNQESRRRELERITRENFAIVQRIRGSESDYSLKEMQKRRREHEGHLKRLRRHGQRRSDIFSRSSSSNALSQLSSASSTAFSLSASAVGLGAANPDRPRRLRSIDDGRHGGLGGSLLTSSTSSQALLGSRSNPDLSYGPLIPLSAPEYSPSIVPPPLPPRSGAAEYGDAIKRLPPARHPPGRPKALPPREGALMTRSEPVLPRVAASAEGDSTRLAATNLAPLAPIAPRADPAAAAAAALAPAAAPASDAVAPAPAPAAVEIVDEVRAIPSPEEVPAAASPATAPLAGEVVEDETVAKAPTGEDAAAPTASAPAAAEAEEVAEAAPPAPDADPAPPVEEEAVPPAVGAEYAPSPVEVGSNTAEAPPDGVSEEAAAPSPAPAAPPPVIEEPGEAAAAPMADGPIEVMEDAAPPPAAETLTPSPAARATVEEAGAVPAPAAAAPADGGDAVLPAAAEESSPTEGAESAPPLPTGDEAPVTTDVAGGAPPEAANVAGTPGDAPDAPGALDAAATADGDASQSTIPAMGLYVDMGGTEVGFDLHPSAGGA